jgi:subtilisin family serine protease
MDMRYLLIMWFVLGFLAMPLESLHATPFTPLKWQDKITKHMNDKFIGQRKHATWVRDRNRNFIDDIIDRRVQKKEKKFDVIVDLNTFLTLDHIRKKFDGYGEVKYIGKMITFVLLNNVEANDLSKIAKMDAVAMIEIQRVFQPALDTSARAVQAKACETCPYSDATAEYTGYTGSKINIAIIDTGVDDDHEQFTCKFIAGFDATVFEDTDHNGVDDLGEEPADGTTNPDNDWNGFNSEGHGTHVAGIALGKGVAGRDCRNLVNEEGNCGGVAREAGLVDIKVCYMKKCEDFVGCAEAICETSDMAEALDWLGFNFDKDGVKVRVANISLTYATEVNESGHTVWDDDGTDAIAQQVNYLSALGILMVAAHGNSIPNF